MADTISAETANTAQQAGNAAAQGAQSLGDRARDMGDKMKQGGERLAQNVLRPERPHCLTVRCPCPWRLGHPG